MISRRMVQPAAAYGTTGRLERSFQGVLHEVKGMPGDARRGIPRDMLSECKGIHRSFQANASQASLHGAASQKVEKALFGALQKGSGELHKYNKTVALGASPEALFMIISNGF